MKTDCLILVERGVSERDMVQWLLERSLRDYFGFLDATVGRQSMRGIVERDGKPVLADYGLATQISLTSVVLGTELHNAGLTFEVIDDDDVVRQYVSVLRVRLQEFKVVAISTTYTVKIQTIISLLRLIRSIDSEIPVVLGGQGLSAWRLQFPDERKFYALLAGANALFFGEAEGVFAGIIKRLAEGRSLDDVPHVVRREGSEFNGDSQPREVGVNDVAIPDWSILNRYDFNDGAISRSGLPSVVSLEEGRGCSFRCKFCSYPLYASFRRKSPERVSRELQAVGDLGFRTASFVGAEFLNPLSQSKRVFEAIAGVEFPIDIWAYARLDLISFNPWVADLMERARFRFIQFGMESGDRDVLKSMGKNYDPGKMGVGARMLRDRGIEVYASLIIGYPGESPQTLANTLNVLADCDFEHVIVHVLHVVPGSRLWHLMDQYKLKIDRFGFWSHPTMHLREVPRHVKNMFVEICKRTSSSINNITQNFAPLFFAGKPSIEQLMLAGRTLQKIVCNEWDQKDRSERDRQRTVLWQELSKNIERLPVEVLVGRDGELRSVVPKADTGAYLVQSPGMRY